MHTHNVLPRGLTIVVTGMILLAGCLWLLNTTQAVGHGSSPLFPSLGATEKYILVDDFKDGDWQNELGGPNACYDQNGGVVSSCKISATVWHSYVEMAYDVTTESAYAWLQMDLGTPENYADLSALDSVWIVIRGENGGERIYAEFKDCGPPETAHYPKVEISNYLAGGITTTWRAAAIPLNAFNGISDWSCIDRLSVMAHHDISSGSGKIYVDDVRLLPTTVLIDDFHDQERENELGGNSGPWYTGTVTITTTYPNGVLKLSYNVPPGNVGGGYWTKLISANLLSQKDYLFFDVRGEQGGEEILAEFKDCGTNGYTHYPKIKVSDYLECGITTSWRTVAIPLAAFVEVQADTDAGVDWNCIDPFNFNVSGQPRYNSGQGTVYIDDVKLAPANILPCRLPILVDRFHDCDDWNALNWEWYTQTIGTVEFTAAPDPVNRLGNCGCGYRFTFTVTPTDSGWAWTELKGLDVTDYFYLQFYIKGKEGGEATHVYLRDRAGNERYKPIEATNNWQRVMIPLSYFTPIVDLTDLSEVKFAYEWAYLTGEVYIDDISFMQPCTVLPIVMKGHCDCGPDSYEPNDSCEQAYGPLTSGQTYTSYISYCDLATYKKSDYFYIDISTTKAINIYLTDIPAGTDYDLYLYRSPSDDPDNPLCKSEGDGSSETISCSPPAAGRYYIRVYGRTGYSTSPYSLRVTYD